MKKIPSCLRLLPVFAMALALAACGGYTSVSIGGKVTDLTADGLVLANAGGTVAIPANATSYTFPNQIGSYASYAVTVQSQPTRQTCIVSNASGTATGIALSSVNVTCSANTFAIGGTVAGLTGAGLVLTNGSDQVAVTAGSTTFVFPTVVVDGNTYGVAVLAQPANQVCTVSNGAGTLNGAKVTAVQVNCI
ncbi:RNase P/RNase MRP subunit p29 [Actimicrobium sp. GrIS 1.19]|uniref:hypothetical protein n=1 Tax=Actimicrobium sp. GrIS 1.19 TaxID=3071708 RepID=UPI002DFEE873|nr:RNase P/RNase MRP subunit p29 [Actimicrobium sp. GrIS 1.19]